MEKNKVGDINNVGHADVGDKTHHHYYGGQPLPKELTLSIPSTSPEDIIGREQDLTQLHHLLNTQQRVVLVNGPGGIGKTTLAQAYVKQYYAHYQHIAWIAQTQENVANDFVNAKGLVNMLGISTESTPAELLFEEIIIRLKSITHCPNLLIIDNGEQSLKTFLDMLPGQPKWHVLVTSREEISGFHLQTLCFLDEEQSIALFNKHYTRKRLHDDDIRALVKMVDYHTLTIEILAKTADMQRFDAEQLKHAIEDNLQANIAVPHNHFDRVERVGSYLQTVFNLSKLSEVEIWLMKQFACLPVEFHSYDLLTELLISAGSASAAVFSETLVGLAKKGWLLENDGDNYKMHPVIMEVVRKGERIAIKDIAHLLDVVTNRLSNPEQKSNPVAKFVWVPFGLALFSEFSSSNTKRIMTLQHNLGLTLRDLGDYKSAQVLLESVVRISEKLFGKTHPETAGGYSNLGSLLARIGDYDSAKVLLEKAIVIKEQYFAADHPSVAGTYSNLSFLLKDMGDLTNARLLADKVLTITQANYGDTHPLTIKRYSNLAGILHANGECEAAKVMLEKMIQLSEQVFGDDHPTTATGYSNLAVVLIHLRDYINAKIFLDKAIRRAERIFTQDHPDLASKYYNMSIVLYEGLDDPHHALPFAEKALQIYKRVLPEYHSRLQKVIGLHNLIMRRIDELNKN